MDAVLSLEAVYGRRKVKSNGYIAIWYPEHPRAFGAGYVYQHRAVVEAILGRYLLPSELVHHCNGVKGDNAEENLMVTRSIGDHKVHHRAADSRLRKAGEPNPLTECECGCGRRFLRFDLLGRPRRFVVGGHARKGRLSYDPAETIECACGCGNVLTRFDSTARERQFISGHNTRKVTKELIAAIKSEHSPYKVSAPMLAAKYGLAVGTVYNVIEGRY
jgi:hypothetical protein